MSKKILLTGASGFLGWNFCRQFASEYDITGTYYRNLPEDIQGVDWQRINLIELAHLAALVKKVQPDLVLHLAAISKASFCEEHPALSHHINVYTTINLAQTTAELGIPMIFSSSDLVFNGASAPYSEEDFCYPLSQYGLQKQTAEDSLIEDFEHTIVARLPLMYGATPSYASNFFIQTIQKLKDKEEVKAFSDEKRSPLSGTEAARWLKQLIDYTLAKKHGERLLQLAGNESISRYDFCLQMAKAYGLDSQYISPTLQQELDLHPPRPQDVTMLNSLAKRVLDFEPNSIAMQLQAELKLLSL